jgi:glucose uptake protein
MPLMLAVLFALIPVIAWGTWLAPAQNVRFPSQLVKTFYVTCANLALASVVLVFQGVHQLNAFPPAAFWLVFSGGVIWTLSGVCAFTATARLGTARAFGIWAPLNILVSMLWGALLFGEFPNTGLANLLMLGISLALVLAGVLAIIFAKGSAKSGAAGTSGAWLGYAGAVGAGVLWGSYYIPIQFAGISMWVGAFPMALGMFTLSLLLVLLTRQPIRLERPSHVFRALFTGLLWSVGNYGMLLLVGALGAGRGFTISQLSVVVNALVGIYFLKDPVPRSPAAWRTLIGCVLATLGGILLGNLK